MKYKVKPGALKGDIFIPPSKSHTMRAIVFGMMGKGKTVIHRFLPSPDAEAMIEAAKIFGCKVERIHHRLEIEGLNGKLNTAENVIDSGNSGQVLRFIGALAGLSPSYTVITGDASIRHNRPVKPLLDAMEQLGATAVSCRLDGYAPIIIKGPMKAGTTTLSGEDSQPVSGMIIAAAFLPSPTHIHVTNPGEKPWIGMTLSWLDRLGIKYRNDNYEHYTIAGGASYLGFEMTVPGDFSSAAFPLAAALITDSEITLQNLDMDDAQGDKKLVEVLMQMGAKIDIDPSNKTLTVKKGSRLKGMKIDINDFIDAVTILAVIGCYAEGKTEIVGASIARSKECDRLACITRELRKMGADIEEKEDSLIITSSRLKGAHLSTYHDHRMVMSLTVAALGAEGESIIEGAKSVAKSFPTFAQEFQALGAQLEIMP